MTKRIQARSLVALAAAGLLLLTACSGDGASTEGGAAEGESVTINAATMVQPNTPNAPVAEWFFSEIEKRSDGRIVVDRTAPESICKAPEIAECVRDGRADVGVSISDYSAQLFPSMSVATIPFMADNAQALMQALHTVNTENEAAVAQWDNAGIELIGAWSPGKAIIGSNEKIENVSDLSGVKFRVTGAALSQAFDKAGANVVALPAAETYEGVERGIADAVSWTMDGPVDYKMMEQLNTWADPGVGHYTTFAIWMNKGFYDSMPADLRDIVDEVRTELNNGAGMEQFNTVTDEQCTTFIEFPNTKDFFAWEQSASDEWKDKVQDDLIEEWVTQAEADGLADAREYLDDYRAALEAAAAQPDIVTDPIPNCIDKFAAK